MRGALERAGERGLSVIARADAHTGALYLLLQSRGVGFADEAAIGDGRPAWPVTVNVSTTTGMMFCPRCGRALADVVAAHRDAYAALARAHGRFRA